MCARSSSSDGWTSLLADPLIRLVMASDGVTEQAMIALIDQLRRSLAARARRAEPPRHVERCPG